MRRQPNTSAVAAPRRRTLSTVGDAHVGNLPLVCSTENQGLALRVSSCPCWGKPLAFDTTVFPTLKARDRFDGQHSRARHLAQPFDSIYSTFADLAALSGFDVLGSSPLVRGKTADYRSIRQLDELAIFTSGPALQETHPLATSKHQQGLRTTLQSEHHTPEHGAEHHWRLFWSPLTRCMCYHGETIAF